jgi:hypothetical protein
MHPQLAHILTELAAARARLQRLAADTPDAHWNERVTPTSWSVAECVAHLNITSRAYVPKLRTAISEARAIGGGAPKHYRRSFFGVVISATTGPMTTIGRIRLGRIKTPPSFVPTGDLPKPVVVAEFEQFQDLLEAFTREADGLPVHRAMMRSTFDERVTYDCYSALLILPRHQHRHLDQAERVNRARASFSAAAKNR